MNYILFDDKSWKNLLPLTFTKPVCEIRLGILTIREKWEKILGSKCSFLTQDYLQKKYPTQVADVNILINGSVIPSKELIEKINTLADGQSLIFNNQLIAAKLLSVDIANFSNENLGNTHDIIDNMNITKISFPWEIFRLNGQEIEADFKLITNGRKSKEISKTNQVINPENVFIEETASVECSILNAKTGYIYIGHHAEIMEGSIVRGPFSLGEHSALKLGAKIYGPTTIGPHSKVGGEVNNTVIFGYSNKAHDGFLGNSVIGEWCNIGADSNNSNLKNNYAHVKLWNYDKERFVDTGLQFCGLIMGDHSKCGINTMFNTGTVVGVSANIFGSGFPRNFVPSFSWGGAAGFTEYGIDKAFETAKLVMERRELELNEIEKEILSTVFEMTKKYRKF